MPAVASSSGETLGEHDTESEGELDLYEALTIMELEECPESVKKLKKQKKKLKKKYPDMERFDSIRIEVAFEFLVKYIENIEAEMDLDSDDSGDNDDSDDSYDGDAGGRDGGAHGNAPASRGGKGGSKRRAREDDDEQCRQSQPQRFRQLADALVDRVLIQALKKVTVKTQRVCGCCGKPGFYRTTCGVEGHVCLKGLCVSRVDAHKAAAVQSVAGVEL